MESLVPEELGKTCGLKYHKRLHHEGAFGIDLKKTPEIEEDLDNSHAFCKTEGYNNRDSAPRLTSDFSSLRSEDWSYAGPGEGSLNTVQLR